MSLTSELDRRDSPVGQFLRDTFPHTRAPLAKCRKALRVPLVSPPSSKAYAQVGTAVDYRIRYHFAPTPWHEFVAAHGAVIESKTGHFGLTDECIAQFVAKLQAEVSKIAPHRRRPTDDEEQTLARFCLVLAAFEAIRRARSGAPPPQHYGGTWPESATDLINLVPADRVSDVAGLGAVFAAQYPSWHGDTTAVLNPKFAGSFDIGGADADFIVDSCLWEIKTTTRKGGQGRDLYQLLGYLLLDYEDEYAVERVGLVFPRQNTRVDWPVTELIAEMSARDDLELPALRSEFRTVCRSLHTAVDLDPGKREKGLVAYREWVQSIEAKGNSTERESKGRSRRSRCEACGRRRVLSDWQSQTDAGVRLCSECLANQRVSEALGRDEHCDCGTLIAPLKDHEAYCLDAVSHNWPRRAVASVAEVQDYLTRQPKLTARLLLGLYMTADLERSDGRIFTETRDGWLCDACSESVPALYEQVDHFFALLEAHRCHTKR